MGANGIVCDNCDMTASLPVDVACVVRRATPRDCGTPHVGAVCRLGRRPPHMCLSFLSRSRSADSRTTGVSPRFFHQCDTPLVSVVTSPGPCTIGTEQLLANSRISPSMM